MAIVEMSNGERRYISAEQGEKLWKGLRDPNGLDEAQLDFLSKVKRLFLNWHVAPDDYIKENLKSIIPIALIEWRVDRYGIPLQPISKVSWAFARRWGLWENGAPTRLVTDKRALQELDQSELRI